MTAAIETRELTKRYGRTLALAGLTMTVNSGEVFGFLGPNGAGKTTAVKVLLGLARASGGEARVLGCPLGDRLVRRRIGYLPELFRYQPWLRAREVLALHCELARMPRATWRGQIEEALRTVSLGDRADDLVGTFSKGMQQRLGLGVALLGSPELVVLDEPTSALDPVGRHDVRGIIRSARDRGITVFLNSHLLTEVERVCDRVAIVDRGQVVAIGAPTDLVAEGAVRIHATGLDRVQRAGLARFGPLGDEGEWLELQVGPELVPEVVAAIVAEGGRIHAVEPRRGTLEDRFLQLLSDRADASTVAAAPEEAGRTDSASPVGGSA
jgi:ABC-2 type transport system ATP-binding protein